MQPETPEPTTSPLDRRDLLKIVAGVGAANVLGIGGCPACPTSPVG